MNPIRHRTTRVDVALAMRRRAMLYAWPRLASAWSAPGTPSRRGLSAFLLSFVAAVVATLLTFGLLGLLFDTSGTLATQQQTHASAAGLTRVTD